MENGYVEPVEVSGGTQLKIAGESKEKLKGFVVHPIGFPRIAAASTSQQAWNILKTEFFCDKKVIAVKL